MNEEVRDALRAGSYEQTEEGVLVPSAKVLIQGVFSVNKRGEPPEYSKNLVVNEGLDNILKVAVGETTAEANWYIALFSGNVTVLATWTAANFNTDATEWTNYDEANRGAWVNTLVASQGTDSFANKASFTSSADTQTVRGAALISSASKQSGSGVLMAASRLSSDKTLATGEILDVGYGLQLTAT